jgi:hypothetical protein
MPKFQFHLADVILALHALVVFFNVFSLPVIWLGHRLKWSFVRNFYFRVAHVALIAFIAVQALAGRLCPLTLWEDSLRLQAGDPAGQAEGFVAHWLRRLIFFEADPRVFTAAYVGFFALTVLTLFAVKPRLPPGWRSRSAGRGSG